MCILYVYTRPVLTKSTIMKITYTITQYLILTVDLKFYLGYLVPTRVILSALRHLYSKIGILITIEFFFNLYHII